VLLKIWHRRFHDEVVVTYREIGRDSSRAWVEAIKNQGGFWAVTDDGKTGVFVPWHSISYIQQEETPDGPVG